MDQTSQQTTSPMPEQRDVSRQTMVVLVILAIVVSLLGTFTVIKETSTQRTVNVQMNDNGISSTQGEVRLEIVGGAVPEQVPPADLATGRVVFEVRNN